MGDGVLHEALDGADAAVMGEGAHGGVGVETEDSCVGQQLFKLGLGKLGPRSRHFYKLAAAFGTPFGKGL